MSTPELAVGTPFVFDGQACTVANVGGKTGRQLTLTPDNPEAAGFDTVTVSLAEAEFHDVLKVWCLPTRILAKGPRSALVTVTPAPQEG